MLRAAMGIIMSSDSRRQATRARLAHCRRDFVLVVLRAEVSFSFMCLMVWQTQRPARATLRCSANVKNVVATGRKTVGWVLVQALKS